MTRSDLAPAAPPSPQGLPRGFPITATARGICPTDVSFRGTPRVASEQGGDLVASSYHTTSLSRLHWLLPNSSFPEEWLCSSWFISSWWTRSGTGVLSKPSVAQNPKCRHRHAPAEECSLGGGTGGCPSSPPSTRPGGSWGPHATAQGVCFPRASLSHPALVMEQTPRLAQEETKQPPLTTTCSPLPLAQLWGVGGLIHATHQKLQQPLGLGFFLGGYFNMLCCVPPPWVLLSQRVPAAGSSPASSAAGWQTPGRILGAHFPLISTEMRGFSCSGRAGAPWQVRGVRGAPCDAPLPVWGWSCHPQSLCGAFLAFPTHTRNVPAALCEQEMGAKSTVPS